MELNNLDPARTGLWPCEEAVAKAVDGNLREYSGRGMYGTSCLGITTGDPIGCIEEAAARGITGAMRDSMGKRYIVYWPDIPAEVQS